MFINSPLVQAVNRAEYFSRLLSLVQFLYQNQGRADGWEQRYWRQLTSASKASRIFWL
jgi:hypothetical protein